MNHTAYVINPLIHSCNCIDHMF